MFFCSPLIPAGGTVASSTAKVVDGLVQWSNLRSGAVGSPVFEPEPFVGDGWFTVVGECLLHQAEDRYLIALPPMSLWHPMKVESQQGYIQWVNRLPGLLECAEKYLEMSRESSPINCNLPVAMARQGNRLSISFNLANWQKIWCVHQACSPPTSIGCHNLGSDKDTTPAASWTSMLVLS